MSYRTDVSPQSAVESEVARLRADLTELKSRQPIDRKLVRRSYVVQTTATRDLDLDPIGPNSFKIYRVAMFGQDVQYYPYAVLYMDVYNGSTLLSTRGLVDASGVGYQWKPEPSNLPNRMDWSISVTTGSSGASISMKFHALSTAPLDRMFIYY